MSPLTLTTLLASAMALALSIGACVVAALSWRQSLSRSSSTLLSRLTEAESTIEGLTLNLRRLQSRVTMLRHRGVLQDATAPTEAEPLDEAESAAQTRAALNDQLARGALKAT